MNSPSSSEGAPQVSVQFYSMRSVLGTSNEYVCAFLMRWDDFVLLFGGVRRSH